MPLKVVFTQIFLKIFRLCPANSYRGLRKLIIKGTLFGHVKKICTTNQLINLASTHQMIGFRIPFWDKKVKTQPYWWTNECFYRQRAVPPFRQSLSCASKISLKNIDVSAPQGILGLWRSKRKKKKKKKRKKKASLERLTPRAPPTAR